MMITYLCNLKTQVFWLGVRPCWVENSK